MLTGICLVLLAAAPRLLASRWWVLGVAAVTATYVWRPWTPGWPPDGWVFVACDVGQGDGLVLRAGEGTAVVVDTGPEPVLIDSCLDRLGVDRVPLVVLTHDHADHVGGLAGVLEGRTVGEIEVTVLDEPVDQAQQVSRVAENAGVPVRRVVPGESGAVGLLSWQVISPLSTGHVVTGTSDGEGSAPNDASIVMKVESRGISVLLGGDLEPSGQARLLAASAAASAPLDVDVLKVPHHASAYQNPDFLAAADPEVAVVSVGAENDYGHPAPSTLDALVEVGAQVNRTDTEGDVAVVQRNGGIAVEAR